MTNTLPITVPRKFVSHKNLNKDGFNFVIWHPQISDWSQQTAICLPISWIFMIYTNINNWSLIQFAFCCMDRVKKGYLPLWVYSKIISLMCEEWRNDIPVGWFNSYRHWLSARATTGRAAGGMLCVTTCWLMEISATFRN